jgi:1-acyl-sn-glycerol-3-phosphate acyltransferase
MSERRVEFVYSPIIGIVKAVWRALDLQFDIRGESNIPRTGPAIMAINHVGYLDFALAGTAALPAKRFVRFMAKREIFDNPIAGPLMRGMRHISVDRKNGAPSFVAALKELQRGEIVGIFPEATISRTFELKEMKSGVTRLAIDSSAPVLPTIIWGSQRIWSKKMARDFSRSSYPISIYVGAPIYFQSDPENSLAALKIAMQGLLDKAISDYPDSPIGQRWAPARLGGTAPTPAMIEAERRKEI